ncbi:MAG TPA: patatin-like phospholipase family protein [Acidimicrobiales bacterium]|nr:patatin-like phospholipase family protein [Acidimicrobiales bacterium]
MRFGLVLGGGGVVGIAWEVGVLAGLQRAGVLDPADAAVIVGTSAGSVVGTRLALGATVESLVEEQSRGDERGPAPSEGTRPRGDMSVVMEIFGELRKAPKVTPEVARVVGQKAMAAPTPPEERWVESFEATIGKGRAWPAQDLRIAALDCNTGERRMWTSADAGLVDLARAVASSCAVPGMFPTVGIGGSRYTDGGVWSGTNADVLVAEALDVVVVIAPTAAAPTEPGRRSAVEVEAEQLEEVGTAVARIAPGPRFGAEIGLLNLMNPAFRVRGVEIGVDDGAASAAVVRRVLG